MPKSALLSTVLVLFLATCVGGYARADSPKPVNVPPGDLTAALELLEKQSGVEIIYRPELLKGIRTNGVKGTLSSEEAVTRLLKGTKLKLHSDRTGVLLITAADAADGVTNAAHGVVDPAHDVASAAELEEVVVTAEKHAALLQDTPVPVTVVDTQSLVESNQVSLAQYAQTIPGLSYIPGNANGGLFTIRGLASGGGNSTVAVLVDGVPFGSTSVISSAGALPDFDPSDLARIEVLRGPQGVLYGASGIGGVINFVTVDPDTTGLNGRVQTDLNSVDGDAGLGYGVRGAVNVPLSDTFAVRVSGYVRHDPGFIQNTLTLQDGVNWSDTTGARVSGLWGPSDNFSVALSALVQNSTQHGSNQVLQSYLPNLLEQSFLPNTGGGHANSQDYSITLKGRIANLDLTSITAYNSNSSSDSGDFTYVYGPYTQTLYGYSGNEVLSQDKTDKLTEELRLSTSFAHRFDWLLGLFYSHESSPNLQQDWVVTNTGASSTRLLVEAWWSTYVEEAAFTDFTVHFTDQFDVQIGARASFYQQRYNEVDSGPLIPDPIYGEGVPSPAVYPSESTDQKAFTYLVTPRFKLSDDLMVYARLASGYRPGGPNYNDLGTLANQVPPAFLADTSHNYEIGAKGRACGESLSYDASIYYIAWKNLQTSLYDPTADLVYFGNAGNAKSEGVELTLESRPVRGLKLSAWGTWNEAVITTAFPPPVYGPQGSRLPYGARVSANGSIQQDFPLTDGVTGFAGGQLTYVGDRLGGFTYGVTQPREVYPAYVQGDVRSGVRFNGWTVNLFVNNVANRRGLVNGGEGAFPNYVELIPPRMFGVSLAKTF